MKRVASEYRLRAGGRFLAGIGYGKLIPRNVIAKYLGQEQFEQLDKQKESRFAVAYALSNV